MFLLESAMQDIGETKHKLIKNGFQRIFYTFLKRLDSYSTLRFFLKPPFPLALVALPFSPECDG